MLRGLSGQEPPGGDGGVGEGQWLREHKVHRDVFRSDDKGCGSLAHSCDALSASRGKVVRRRALKL
jgi:hypothetical protein